MKFWKLAFCILLLVFLVFSGGKVLASEGTTEIRSTTNETYRCWAASLRMQNLQYTIVVSCYDLLYPAGENIFSYVMWATSKEDAKPIKLGALGFGKAQFATKVPFTELYVTTEADANRVRTPSGPTVMRGRVEPLTFLQRPTTPTPTSTEEKAGETTDEKKPQKSLRERVLLGLRRAGLAALLAIVAIFGLVFILTRSRG